MKRALLVAEANLKRPLLPGEVVHHLNSNTMDDRPENISTFPNASLHAAYHNSHRIRSETSKNKMRGINHPCAKITDDLVRAIIAAKGVEPQRVTANRFGISQQLVSRVRARNAWKHVTTS